MNCFVSVIIPCFNQGRFLFDAISSLQAQTYPDWEAVIVNDGSEDETAEIASALCHKDRRVRYIAQVNEGLSSARNAGIRASNGDFIQFLDADDQLEIGKLEQHIKTLQKHPEIDIVYGNAKYFIDDVFGIFDRGPYGDGPDHDWISECWYDPRPILSKLIERNLFPVCCPMIRRSLQKQAGLFNEELDALEDWEYWLRCASVGARFQYIDAVGTDVLIRKHSASMTQDSERIKHSGFLMRMVCHEWLPFGDVRDFNLQCLLAARNRIEDDGNSDSYSRIVRGCRSWQEHALVLENELSKIGGPFNMTVYWLLKLFPCNFRYKFNLLWLKLVRR